MQAEKKQIILCALANTSKRLRGEKSQYLLGAEYDIPSSIISDIERKVKDPQLTTLFKLAFAYNMNLSEFIKELEKELPNDFYTTDL